MALVVVLRQIVGVVLFLPFTAERMGTGYAPAERDAAGEKSGVEEQLGQHPRVDLVCLRLRLGDRPCLLRIRDDERADVSLEQPRDRMRGTGRLDRDLVGRSQALGEQPQCLRRRLDLTRLADLPTFPDRHLRELAMNVKPDTASHAPSFHQPCWSEEHRRANDTYGFPLAAHPGKSQGRPSNYHGLEAHRTKSGLPDLRLLPDAPVPDGRAVLPSPDATGVETVMGPGRHLPPFIRDTNSLERAFVEVRQRTKVIGRFPGETSALSLVWAVLERASRAGAGSR